MGNFISSQVELKIVFLKSSNFTKRDKKNKKTSIAHYARLLQRLHPDISKRNRIGVVLKLYKDFF